MKILGVAILSTAICLSCPAGEAVSYFGTVSKDVIEITLRNSSEGEYKCINYNDQFSGEIHIFDGGRIYVFMLKIPFIYLTQTLPLKKPSVVKANSDLSYSFSVSDLVLTDRREIHLVHNLGVGKTIKPVLRSGAPLIFCANSIQGVVTYFPLEVKASPYFKEKYEDMKIYLPGEESVEILKGIKKR